MSEPVQILRYHVDVESRQIVVQYRRVDKASGAYLPLAPNMMTHRIPLKQELLDAIEQDVKPLLERDMAEVADVAPAAVTSALHQLREVRHEAAQARSEAVAREELHQKRIAEARAEHDTIKEQKLQAEVELDVLRRRAAGIRS